MRRLFRLLSLLVMASLAACSTKQAPPPQAVALQVPPPAPAPPMPPQPSVEAPPPAVPQQSPTPGDTFIETGLASFYGRAHDGNTTANGKSFDHREFTAAHRTLAFGTLVRVTNLSNGRTVTVEITDRGPHIKTRIIDISLAAARALHMQRKGVTRVRLEAIRQTQARAD